MFSFGWETFKKRPWFFIGVTVLIIVINFLIGKIINAIAANGGVMALLGNIINLATSTLIGMGTVALYLKAHDNTESALVADLWHPQGFWRYLGAILLYGIAMIIAMIPFIIAIFLGIVSIFTAIGFSEGGNAGGASGASGVIGIVAFILALIGIVLALYVSSMLIFGPYTVIDRGTGPINALKESMRITKGNRWKIVGFLVVGILIAILGFICLFVGIFVAAPVISLALTHLYRMLSGAAPMQTPTPVAAPAPIT